jgi:hypothetical protein
MNWALVSVAASSISLFGHIFSVEWLRYRLKKLDKQDREDTKKYFESLSYPKKRLIAYLIKFDKKRMFQQFAALLWGTVWIPLLVIPLILAGIFMSVQFILFEIMWHWHQFKQSRLTPEQQRVRAIAAEAKILEAASKARLSPDFEADDPASRNYRGLIAAGERMALNSRKLREAEEQSTSLPG